ncbi:hypothetical protein BWI17_10230 [Betaproteobacteria bacterium GR16-43]|nr:hypothetical protein BWI17_10230 [Betaproteobacteria bacterium GR16-43]
MKPRQAAPSFLLSFLLCISAAAAAGEMPGAGDVAPTGLGLSRSGQALDRKQFEGKVLVVTFWASWCGPCRAELPVLEGLQIAAGKEKIQVVAVNIESREDYKRIMRNMPAMTLEIAHDPNKTNSTAYGVKGIPHLVIIGRDGKIVRVHRGYGEDSINHILADIKKAIDPPAS